MPGTISRPPTTTASIIAAVAAMVPAGTVVPYAGSSAPSNWLLCYGQAVSRTTYASLFAVVSTTFGIGDGTTTFNVPDLRGRVVAGLDNMGGSAANILTGATTLGAVSGDEDAALIAHTHNVTTSNHTHTVNPPNTAATVSTAGGAHTHDMGLDVLDVRVPSGAVSGFYGVKAGNDINVTSDSASAGHVHVVEVDIASFNSGSDGGETVASASAGSGTGTGANVQPTMVLNHIIFCGLT